MSIKTPFELYFNPEDCIMYGIYGRDVTPEVTAELYSKGIEMVLAIGQEKIKAYLFDFRQVRHFDKRIMLAVQSQSVRVHNALDLINTPTVLLVKSPLQERIVSLSMQFTPGQRRKALVHSMEEAHTFIKNWHAAQTS